jgi:hypothetical protein
VLDNVRQGDWRILLAVGMPPLDWPMISQVPSANSWVEAESPWFPYFADLDPADPDDAKVDTKERALQRCADWFLLALAKKRAFLTGEGLELGGEVFDVAGVRRDLQDLFDRGKEVVEGSDRGQWGT